MKILVSHPTGNANVRSVIEAMERADVLEEFITCFSANAHWNLLRWLPENIRRELLRRNFDIQKKHIHEFPFRELSRIGLARMGFSRFVKHEKGAFSVDAVYRNLDKRVARRLNYLSQKHDVNAVYAYEDGASQTFAKAKQLGVRCIYDLPIGYWRASRSLLSSELDKWPEWSDTLTGFKDSDEKLERKDLELHAADHIFVASTFTKNTLLQFPGILPEISVIPYGFPTPVKERLYNPLRNRPLKLLFVGGLSQRKGIANLFAATDRLGSKVELTVIGRKASETCAPLNAALRKHRYIASLPHLEVLREMRESDVLVFPSLFEGFGLVITEAMSQGTPVITTDRTCGPDLIEHDRNGWIVEAGNTDALQAQIETLLLHPERIEKAGREAIATSSQRPWSEYGDEVVHTLTQINAQASDLRNTYPHQRR